MSTPFFNYELTRLPYCFSTIFHPCNVTLLLETRPHPQRKLAQAYCSLDARQAQWDARPGPTHFPDRGPPSRPESARGDSHLYRAQQMTCAQWQLEHKVRNDGVGHEFRYIGMNCYLFPRFASVLATILALLQTPADTTSAFFSHLCAVLVQFDTLLGCLESPRRMSIRFTLRLPVFHH
jgi:hypothetical protein